ncbi:hypothetical protein PENARI_c011G02802 [Penicillium arizonense]|uniref:Arylsulfotransferase n=1 Tax=Penicillium arizonense TaxID=1835702 RepID=A0A1F5LFG3_PENAI|nr:hypothetical protein PENARI_c011G02802 [Penicillium arizonense]OGE51954.1 hypothetical protein PENARI_c011G02802 [Penicillium arizonense]
MKLPESSLSWLLPFCVYISGAVADIGPYFGSAKYDAGEFGRWPHQSFRSSPIIGPVLNIQQHDAECENDGLLLLGPGGDEVFHSGPTIIDQRYQLVWNEPLYGKSWAVDVKYFRGVPYLTFWADKHGGQSNAAWYMLNSSYDEVYTIHPAGGWKSDDHEFDITRDQTGIVAIEMEVPFDLSAVGGPRDGWILDNGFQELDIETGKVLFQWRASAHWDLAESYQNFTEHNGTSQEEAWDFFHQNSVQKDSRGNYLISSRHMSTIAYIDGQTGSVLWKLGGKQNTFSDLSGHATDFNGQHHARFLEDWEDRKTATISLFDNGSGGRAQTHPTSGKIVKIDVEKWTAQLKQQYSNPHHRVNSVNRGSTQVLPSGNVLLGYGSAAAWSEFSADGDLLCDVHFGPQSRFSQGDVVSYRVFKRQWLGSPREGPSLSIANDIVYVSWNGATEVTAWELQGSNYAGTYDDADFFALKKTQKAGFETDILLPKENKYQYLRVVGLNQLGKKIGYSSIIDRYPPTLVAQS